MSLNHYDVLYMIYLLCTDVDAKMSMRILLGKSKAVKVHVVGVEVLNLWCITHMKKVYKRSQYMKMYPWVSIEDYEVLDQFRKF